MNIFTNKALSLACRLAVFLLVTCCMIACGGGGGDSPAPAPVTASIVTGDTSPPTSDDYSPDPSLLGEVADTTLDLYVEPEFNFSGVKTVVVDLNVRDMDGQAAANAIVKVFVVSGKASKFEEVRAADKSLLSLLKTDAAGNIVQSVSVAQTVDKLLISVDLVGIDNNALIALDENLLAQYQF